VSRVGKIGNIEKDISIVGRSTVESLQISLFVTLLRNYVG